MNIPLGQAFEYHEKESLLMRLLLKVGDNQRRRCALRNSLSLHQQETLCQNWKQKGG